MAGSKKLRLFPMTVPDEKVVEEVEECSLKVGSILGAV